MQSNHDLVQNASESPAVQVDHLSRTFSGVEALREASLKVPRGSVFGLVGLNGAGKTTLLSHLIGTLRPQSGRVRVLGEDPVADPEGVLKRIGYLSEEDALPRWMRVGELIDFARALYPTWDDAYASELCEVFGLSRATKLSSQSKGQRARVGLLLATAHRPELLILDEPSSGLDPLARRDILEAVIRSVNDEAHTVLFSSHLLDDVSRVCDSVALMSDGEIIETSTIEAIESRYLEIIVRPADAAQRPPAGEEAFGWVRTGEEWSGVLDRQLNDDLDQTLTTWPVVERRRITLDRWFEARVRDAKASPEIAAPQTEVAHV